MTDPLGFVYIDAPRLNENYQDTDRPGWWKGGAWPTFCSVDMTEACVTVDPSLAAMAHESYRWMTV